MPSPWKFSVGSDEAAAKACSGMELHIPLHVYNAFHAPCATRTKAVSWRSTLYKHCTADSCSDILTMSSGSSKVIGPPQLPLSVSLGTAEDAKEALLPVLRGIPMPEWQQARAEDLHVERCSGAMTNLVFKCRLHAIEVSGREVIVRVPANEEQVFDKAEELATSQRAAITGLGPALLALFNNGRVEMCLSDYVTATAQDLRGSVVSGHIARALAAFHVHMTLPPDITTDSSRPQSNVYTRVHGWLRRVQTLWADADQQLLLAGLGQQLERLCVCLEQHYPSWPACCHCDLQYGNILLRRGEEDGCSDCVSSGSRNSSGNRNGPDFGNSNGPNAGSSSGGACPSPGFAGSSNAGLADVRLIDYDYCTTAPSAFDIANHFCEWAADYHSPSSPPHLLRYNRLPDEAQQRAFVLAYLVEMLSQHGMLVQVQDGVAGNDVACTVQDDARVAMQGTASVSVAVPCKESAIASGSSQELNLAGMGMLAEPTLKNELSGHEHDVDLALFLHPLVEQGQGQGQGQCPANRPVSTTICQLPAPGTSSKFASWLQCYARPRAYQELDDNRALSIDVHAAAEGLRLSALAHVALSHAHWGVWGMLQHKVSLIQGFDYLQYGHQRLANFKQCMALLGLQ